MPEINPLGGGPFNLPDPRQPSISFSQVRQTTDRAERAWNALEAKIKKEIHEQLRDAGNVGAQMEVKVATPLAGRLDVPESLLNDLVTAVQGDLAGKLAPAVALLEVLGHPIGALPELGKGLGQLPNPPPGVPRSAGDGVRFISAGEASRGLSAGALSAKEQELGVDPVIADSSQVLLQEPSSSSGQPTGSVEPPHQLSQRAKDWLATCQADPFRKDVCGPPYQVWAPPQPLSSDQMAAGLVNPCVVQGGGAEIPSGWIPCGDPVASLDAALDFADQCTAAGGRCPTGQQPVQPSPPTQPTQPPTPIGSPPPPPPECCPPPVINVPPCPPPPSIPDCVKIEFCDWEKLCSTLRDCLPGAKPAEDCSLDNTDAWVYKDCEGTFGAQLQQFLGDALSPAAESETLQGMVDAALGVAGLADASSFAPLVMLQLPPTEEPV
jgi:hypothetical protein